jgi:predicted ArsR family transcriptional regulator
MSHQLKVDHWGKILFAMRLLGISCSSEAIAKKAGMKEAQTYRRMSELIADGCVYVSGKGLTSSGRPCALYSLTEHGKQKQEANASEQPKEPFTQPSLF